MAFQIDQLFKEDNSWARFQNSKDDSWQLSSCSAASNAVSHKQAVCPSPIRFTQGAQPPLSRGLKPSFPHQNQFCQMSHAPSQENCLNGATPQPKGIQHCRAFLPHQQLSLSSISTIIPQVTFAKQRPSLQHRAGDCRPAIHLSVVPPTTFSCSLDRISLAQVTCHLWNASASHPRRIPKLLGRASQCHSCSGLARAGFACVRLKGTGHKGGQGFLPTH